MSKIPTIIETHSVNTKKPEFQRLIKLNENKFFKGIVTIHEDLKQKFINEGISRKKVIVLEDVVDLEKFEKITSNLDKLRKYLNLPKNKKIVMYCGSLKPGKGIGKILETAKYFTEDTLFYIVGGEKKEIKYYYEKAKLDGIKNVIFTGFVKNKLVPFYLKSADILFMPYDLTEKNKIMDINTTSPIKLFEYMAANKPIVSTKIPTLQKIVQHNIDVLLSNPEDITETVKNIKDLFENNEKGKMLALNAYKKAKEYTYVNRCRKILKEFGEI